MDLEEKINQLVAIWFNFDPENGEMAPSTFGKQEADFDISLPPCGTS